MSLTKSLAITFALLGLIAAVVAAFYWWKASTIASSEPVASISDAPELHILGNQVTFNESSRLNSIAARWTGVGALLSAVASVLGVL